MTPIELEIPAEYLVVNITMVHRHGQATGQSVLVRGKRRCDICGHRLTVNGVRPVQTRELPVRTWHQELIDRYRAKRMLS